jgi:hypothetical protein
MSEHRYTYPTVIELRPSARGALVSQGSPEVRPQQLWGHARPAPIVGPAKGAPAENDAW